MKKEKEKKKKRLKRDQPAEPKPEKAKGEAERKPEAEAAAPPEPEGDEPLRRAVAAVGGKWKLRILWTMRGGESLRYGEIKQQVAGITDMMLSQSLRELTAAGFTERRAYQEIPPKVEYRLTPSGAELIPAAELLRAWAVKYTGEES